VLNQGIQADPCPFSPVFAPQIFSRREATKRFVLRHGPARDFPMLESRNPHQIAGKIDHCPPKTVLLSWRLLDDVVSIISLSRPCHGALKLIQGPRRIEICLDGVFILEKPSGPFDDLLLLLDKPSRDLPGSLILLLWCRWSLLRDDRLSLKARQLAEPRLCLLGFRYVGFDLGLDVIRETLPFVGCELLVQAVIGT
jgi:hypothetical protein